MLLQLAVNPQALENIFNILQSDALQLGARTRHDLQDMHLRTP